ncbi:MAG: hypothetical protein H0U75_07605 [Legionella sp.]|nr:hypothetical protein [Legionella sp.]
MCKTFNDIAIFAQEIGFDVGADELLAHQAEKILTLSEDQAEALASK